MNRDGNGTCDFHSPDIRFFHSNAHNLSLFVNAAPSQITPPKAQTHTEVS
jgi:hypothetical protein